MKKKKLRKLLEAVAPFARIAPFYDMKGIRIEDTETISVGHWIRSGVNILGNDFSAACAFTLADFRNLSDAFVELQSEVGPKPKKPKIKVKCP